MTDQLIRVAPTAAPERLLAPVTVPAPAPAPVSSVSSAPSERRANPRQWEDARSLDALEVVAEGVTQFAGFEVASILLVRGDEVECVAVSGPPEARAELLGTRSPLQSVLDRLPDDRRDRPRFVWLARSSHPASTWQPWDGLVVPLLDDDRTLCGLLAVDRPRDGRRPRPAQLRILEHYAVQARRAVLTALEREDLTRRMALARTARLAIRTATTRLSLEGLVQECREALVAPFRADEVWLQLTEQSQVDRYDAEALPGVRLVVERLAHEAWRRQEAFVLHPDTDLDGMLDPTEVALMRSVMAARGIGSVLLAPLGAGDECLGRLVLCRAVGVLPWTEVEADSALDVGHDLGLAVLTTRAYEREHDLVEELTALDTYKTRLISTISHELRTPLTSVLGNLELLEDELDDQLDDRGGGALARAHRGARRLVDLVDDLLLLSQVADAPMAREPVDLAALARDVRDLTSIRAQQAGQRVVLEGDAPVLTCGDRRELDRVVTNLVSNALKYSPAGSTVTVRCERVGDEVSLSVADEGIGISAEDRRHLFREFFRSAEPSAQRQPGTGLGLSIVQRIVARHGGRVDVESSPGQGSTFVVHLPAG